MDSQAACLVDGPTDDYESWDEEIAEDFLEEEAVLYAHYLLVPWRGKIFDVSFRQYRTEATITESREVVILLSGAWKT